METITFTYEQHEDANRYLDRLEWFERDCANDSPTMMAYIGMTYHGEMKRVMIED